MNFSTDYKKTQLITYNYALTYDQLFNQKLIPIN